MPALDSIEVEGYKSIRSAKIELRAVNVLIGANGAGKSNLVSIFGLLRDLIEQRLQLNIARAGGANAMLHFGRKRTPSMRVRARFGDDGYEARLGAAGEDTLVFESELPLFWGEKAQATGRPYDERLGSGHRESKLLEASDDKPVAAHVLKGMQGWWVYHFHDTGRSAPARQKQKLDDNRTLRAEGDNLAPFLFALKQRASGSYRRIVEAVRSVAPFFDDFILAPDVVNPDVIQLAWRHKSDDARFTADSFSDGTLRFVSLATLLLQPELPSVVVIDEPELGLHPFAIGKLAALVQSAATKSQVLITTQSVTLLDQFEPEDVIVVDRDENESMFRRLDERLLAGWLEEYSVGDLWLKNVLSAVRPGP